MVPQRAGHCVQVRAVGSSVCVQRPNSSTLLSQWCLSLQGCHQHELHARRMRARERGSVEPELNKPNWVWNPASCEPTVWVDGGAAEQGRRGWQCAHLAATTAEQREAGGGGRREQVSDLCKWVHESISNQLHTNGFMNQ